MYSAGRSDVTAISCATLARRNLLFQMRSVLLGLLASAIALHLCGCGSGQSSGATGDGGGSQVTRASSMVPHRLPLSPPDPGGIIAFQQGGKARRANVQPVNKSSAASPNTVHWFYLINGEGIPPGVTNTTTPPVNWTPNVLTVNGTAPGGAPNPNGGTGIAIAAMKPASNGSQLWKAVAATTSGYVYLRSAESFTVNNAQGFSSTTNSTNWPNLLVGYGATAAPLDVGNASFNPSAIYWNQSGSPTGDNSAFQSWQYKACDDNFTEECGELVNLGNSSQLLNESSSPNDQWYAYPSYYAEQVVQQPNSDPPFPANTDEGELAAYEYLSCVIFNSQLGCSADPKTPPLPPLNCTLEGTAYNGIRCAYIVPSTSYLSACTSLASSTVNPGSTPATLTTPDGGKIPAGTAISDSDWANVTNQLYLECLYAGDIQTVFSNYGLVMTDVFLNTEAVLPQLAIDLGLSQNQNVSAVPIDILEGTLYTLLSATGNTGAGVVANLMSMGVNTAQAADSGSSLKNPVTAEVQDLYTQLHTQFTFLTQQTANGENAILEDWGRLEQLGPLAIQTGYNGLALDTANGNLTKLEQQVREGYALSVMQQLLPVSKYVLQSNLAGTSSSAPVIAIKYPSWDQYSYLTFGTFPPANYNVGWFMLSQSGTEYPSQTVMQTDIMDNGANPFEVFNGINGWKAMPLGGITNMDCSTTVATLFNATPTDLSVTVTPQQGVLAASGYNFNGNGSASGDENAAGFELRPYGYLPIYVSANGSGGRDLTMVVTISDGSNQVASFTFGNDGCTQNSYNVWNVSSSNNYGFSPAGYPNTRYGNLSVGNPTALWWTITNTSLTPQ